MWVLVLTATEQEAAAATNPSTEERSRAKGGHSSEAYYAQLREVHGCNMRALEAIEAFPWRRTNRAADPDTINSLAESVMRDIAADGDLVTKQRVREGRSASGQSRGGVSSLYDMKDQLQMFS